jgi:hypothetical protein
MMNDTTRTRLKVRHGRKHTSETWQAQRLAVRRSFLMQRTTWAATCHENETAPSCSLDKERDISCSSGSFLFLFFVCCFSFRTRRLSDHTPSAASLYGRLAACFSIQCTTGDTRIYWHCTRELQTFADLFFRIESKSQPHPHPLIKRLQLTDRQAHKIQVATTCTSLQPFNFDTARSHSFTLPHGHRHYHRPRPRRLLPRQAVHRIRSLERYPQQILVGALMVVFCQFRHLAGQSAGTASGDLGLKHAGETH